MTPNIPDTDEKNEKCKQTIRVKVEEYMARAEKLKEFLDKQSKQPVAQGGPSKYVILACEFYLYVSNS